MSILFRATIWAAIIRINIEGKFFTMKLDPALLFGRHYSWSLGRILCPWLLV